jgi:xylulokinase
MSLIGLDIGTTGCKAIVFSSDGEILARGARECTISSPQPGWAEQDGEQVWKLAWECVREAVALAHGDPPLALALSVQGEAVAPVDDEGRALCPFMLGMDTRTGAENRWLVDNLGAEALFGRTGMPVHTINTLPKLLWFLRHDSPDMPILPFVDRYVLYEDFFLRKLGGKAVISHCLASRTQMYDTAAGDWATDILERCGIDRQLLSPLAPVEGGVVGALRPDLQRQLGLRREVLLVSGGHDQACAALGSGVIEPGAAMVSTGTAEVVEVAMSTPALTEPLRRGNISVYRHVVPGLYLAMTLNHSGGLLLRWFRDTLGAWEMAQAASTGRDAYDLILAEAPEGPTPLFVLPHFAGSGTPWLDTSSKGAILGLTFATTRPMLAKAMIEGLTFELRVNLDLLKRGGVDICDLHAVGGGARSPLWLQLKADICQVPLVVPHVTEAACLGAALLAGVGAGVYRDLGEGVHQTVRTGQRVQPRPGSVVDYERRFHLYEQVYPILSEISAQM